MNNRITTGTGHAVASEVAHRLLVISVTVCLVLGSYGAFRNRVPAPHAGIQSMDAESLAQFDGTNPNKPIYLALDGFVYDVSAGKTYYMAGGPYHFLAGKDSSKDLHIAGAGIIKQKYPVVATFTK